MKKKNKENNYAFIDSQNLNLGTLSLGMDNLRKKLEYKKKKHR